MKDKQPSDTEPKETIKFVTTPKCADCTPTAEKLTRRSCMGCVKYNLSLKEMK
jgi:hypothetical protein